MFEEVDFLHWLAEHRLDLVGVPSTPNDNPITHWLSDTYGVESYLDPQGTLWYEDATEASGWNFALSGIDWMRETLDILSSLEPGCLDESHHTCDCDEVTGGDCLVALGHSEDPKSYEIPWWE
jgi:hypothetical protein